MGHRRQESGNGEWSAFLPPALAEMWLPSPKAAFSICLALGCE